MIKFFTELPSAVVEAGGGTALGLTQPDVLAHSDGTTEERKVLGWLSATAASELAGLPVDLVDSSLLVFKRDLFTTLPTMISDVPAVGCDSLTLSSGLPTAAGCDFAGAESRDLSDAGLNLAGGLLAANTDLLDTTIGFSALLDAGPGAGFLALPEES